MADAAKRRREQATSDATTRDDDGHVCTVSFCPICLAVTTVQPIRPEAVEHLVNAGREFLLAMTAVLAARAGERGDTETATLTRIDIE